MRKSAKYPRLPRRAAARVAGTTLALLAVVFAMHAPPADASNGARPMSAGAKASGRGTTEVAVADDALSTLNPAGIGFIPGIRGDANLTIVLARSRTKDALNDDLEEGYDFIPAVGVSFDPFGPPRRKSEDPPSRAPWIFPSSRLRLGLQVFVPFGGGGPQEFKSPLFPEGQDEGSGFTCIAVAPTIAFRPIENLSIGMSLNIQYIEIESEGTAGSGTSSNGRVLVYGVGPNPQPLPPPNDMITFNDLFSAVGSGDSNSGSVVKIDADGYGVSATFGVLWQASPAFSFGISYVTQGWFSDLEGEAKVDASSSIAALNADPAFAAVTGFLFQSFLPNGGQQGFKAKYDFTLEGFKTPDIISAGVAVRPIPRLLLALDVRVIGWSRAFDTQQATLDGGDNEDINTINGGDEIAKKQIQDWDDQYVVAVGAAFGVTDFLALRCGYNYGSNPVPKETAGPGATAFLEHHITLGFSFYVQRVDVDFSYVYALPDEITVGPSKSNPMFDGVKIRAEQHFISFGIGVSF